MRKAHLRVRFKHRQRNSSRNSIIASSLELFLALDFAKTSKRETRILLFLR